MADSQSDKNASASTKRSFNLAGCLLKSVVIVGLLGVVGYFVQGYIAPEVDEEKTKAVVIKDGGESSADPNLKTGESADVLNLPPGAITANVSQKQVDAAEHPFDPLLGIAAIGVKKIDEEYQDYTATLVSQVLAGGTLRDEKYIFCKIRHEQPASDDKPAVPFSVYTKFLKPKANVGQEAIWVKGWNDGKLIAHTTGLLNVKRFPLDPEGSIAMDGNRYPIYEIGFRNLLVKMADIGTEDKKHGECTVEIKRNVELNGRMCTVLEAKHPVKRDHFEFHIARIYMDDELNIPIGYEGFLWPEEPGGELPILERYFYTDLKLNIGLTDEDFDPGNKEYNYPKW